MQNLRSCRGTTIGYLRDHLRAPSKTHDRHVQHELHEPAAACTRACPPDRTQHAPTPPIHALCVVPCLGLLSHRRRPPFPQIGRPIDSKVSARPPATVATLRIERLIPHCLAELRHCKQRDACLQPFGPTTAAVKKSLRPMTCTSHDQPTAQPHQRGGTFAGPDPCLRTPPAPPSSMILPR